MNKNKLKSYWLIRGWDSTKILFEHKIYTGQISEKRMKELLKVLTSKISLSEEEIISSYAKRKTKAHTNYLDVQILKGKKYMLSCGTNPYVTAEVEYEKEEK